MERPPAFDGGQLALAELVCHQDRVCVQPEGAVLDHAVAGAADFDGGQGSSSPQGHSRAGSFCPIRRLLARPQILPAGVRTDQLSRPLPSCYR